jgi:cold shock protein
MQRRASGSFNLTPAARTFVHISAVERAGMSDLNEGQKIAYEVVADKRTGKSSADNLKPA